MQPGKYKICWKLWGGCLAAFFLLIAGLLLADRLCPLPLHNVHPARIVVTEDGTPLWRFADENGVWRYPVEPDEVSPRYLEALINYEDRWFWHHPGVNPLSLVRAAWQWVRNGEVVSGGSTLTMQVARLIDPQPRTITGKLIQTARALQLEWHLSKQQILTLYLNRAPFGGTLEGVGAACWAYLGKSPAHLTDAEAALLAVLPQAPSRLRPDRWSERAQKARDKVLARMQEEHIWSARRVREAMQEPVWLAPRQSPQLAPLLARYLLTQDNHQRIVTTIDATLQSQLETLALNWKHRLPPKTSLAILVVDHQTMKVRGWVGSVDLNDDSRFGHVDMVRAVRSPGSLLKPFLYGLALDEGLIHPGSLLQDVPRRFGDYRPGNFDSDFNGPVSMSEALVRSLNLPAVQVLDALGPKNFAGHLRNIGLNLRLPAAAEPNLSLILGGAGTRLDELVSAYSAFAREGKVARLRLQPQQPLVERRLLSPGSAWIIRRVLGGEEQPLPDGALPAVAPFAWKTGTSYGYRDAWAIGVSPRYLIGVWTGRPDATPVAGQYGFASAVPVMNQVNTLLRANTGLAQNREPADPRPGSVTSGTICWPGGQSLPEGDSNCRRRVFTWLLNDSQPPTLLAPGQEGPSGIVQRLWLNSKGLRVGADCKDAHPATLLLWPLPLEPWLPAKERRDTRLPAVSTQCPPMVQANLSPLLLLGVRDGAMVKPPAGQAVLNMPLSTQGGGHDQWWFLNGDALPQQGNHVTLSLTHSGEYQVLVMDDSGQIAAAHFTLLPK